MTVLTIWSFAAPERAAQAEGHLGALSAGGAVSVLDGAVVSWPPDRPKPRSRQLQNIPLTGSIEPAFWGILFGTLFFAPILGPLAGSDVHALSGILRGVGIGDDLVEKMRESIQPDTSAILVLTGDAKGSDAATDAFGDARPLMLQAVLTPDHDRAFKEIFGAYGRV